MTVNAVAVLSQRDQGDLWRQVGGVGRGPGIDLTFHGTESELSTMDQSREWIDAHEKELGIGRPDLDKDPPHVAPIDGKEYTDKRDRAKAQLAGLAKNGRPELAANDNHAMTKRAKTVSR